MKEREGIILSSGVCLLLVAWLGFFFHTSPRFAGSGPGAAFGIAGAVLMLIPLAYPIAKRIPFLHDRITKTRFVTNVAYHSRLLRHPRPSARAHPHRAQVQ